MRPNWRYRVVFLASFAVPLLCQAPIETGRRLALVIGNSAYRAGNSLQNPGNDARAMAARLTELKFDVILKVEANQRDMEEAIKDFADKLGPGVLGLFFYAGHGMQLDGVNYLLPIDFDSRGKDELSVKSSSVPADEVLERMEKAKATVNLLILDACRDNPFIVRRTRSSAKGLAAMNAGEGSAIMFATRTGQTADDNPSERNGVFTKNLLEVLQQPGLSLGQVSEEVTARVLRSTSGGQRPTYVSEIGGTVVLNMNGPAIRIPDRAPRITELSADRSTVAPNETVTLRVSASDADGERLQFTWAATGGTIEGRGDTAIFSPGPIAASAGASTVTITATARSTRGIETSRDILVRVQPSSQAALVTGRAITVGPAVVEVWLESKPSTGAAANGVVEAELSNVEHVWQVSRVQGSFPGLPITVASPECASNCSVVAVVEKPSPENGFLRMRLRVQPASPVQPMRIRFQYQPQTGKRK